VRDLTIIMIKNILNNATNIQYLRNAVYPLIGG
jgi:hypothetical protein